MMGESELYATPGNVALWGTAAVRARLYLRGRFITAVLLDGDDVTIGSGTAATTSGALLAARLDAQEALSRQHGAD